MDDGLDEKNSKENEKLTRSMRNSLGKPSVLQPLEGTPRHISVTGKQPTPQSPSDKNQANITNPTNFGRKSVPSVDTRRFSTKSRKSSRSLAVQQTQRYGQDKRHSIASHKRQSKILHPSDITTIIYPPNFEIAQESGKGAQESLRRSVAVKRSSFNPNQKKVLSRYPVALNCPFCHHAVVTQTKSVTGRATWLACFLFVLVCMWLGCCLIPFFLAEMKDTHHTCPNCFNLIDVYKPF